MDEGDRPCSVSRLGTFLFLRILKDGHDRRFNHVRDSPGTFFVYWTLQGISPTHEQNLREHLGTIHENL